MTTMPNEIAPAQMLRMNYPYPESHQNRQPTALLPGYGGRLPGGAGPPGTMAHFAVGRAPGGTGGRLPGGRRRARYDGALCHRARTGGYGGAAPRAIAAR